MADVVVRPIPALDGQIALSQREHSVLLSLTIVRRSGLQWRCGPTLGGDRSQGLAANDRFGFAFEVRFRGCHKSSTVKPPRQPNLLGLAQHVVPAYRILLFLGQAQVTKDLF